MSTALATMRLLLTTASTTSLFSSYSLDFPSKSLKTGNPILNHTYLSRRKSQFLSNPTWLCGHIRRDQDMDYWKDQEEIMASLFDRNGDTGTQIPSQAQSIVEGSSTTAVSEYKPIPDVDYLQELLAIQQQGPRSIGFFGTRNMGFMHQELIEILSYALVITKNHIYTSGASGTNAAVIRGALRAEKPELLTVILPQSLKKQPSESQELLAKVQNVIEKPHNDHLPLIEASRCAQTFYLLVHNLTLSY
ncbi:uncharacterized protein LOC105644899 isoform X1 [Jatropha curcas]|uniref:uncharacterized protein LOC105644899 isoform X1 n=2 Tax=Jatropha curcas TaxID=180498 RepID=UPI001895FD4B|nr:uncharacterized protein LOC105644899 isoform X1 [Jatropha curcas]